MKNIEFEKLQAVFPPDAIDWRIQSAGLMPDKSAVKWAIALAYIDARAVQERLDSVCGIENWKSSYQVIGGAEGGFLCTLSIFDGGKWIDKTDGAPATDFEAFKGGLSKSFVRVAASGWGIGRYLYRLEAGFVDVSSEKKTGWNRGEHKDRDGKKYQFFWQPPKLPDWAIPNIRADFMAQFQLLKASGKDISDSAQKFADNLSAQSDSAIIAATNAIKEKLK